LALVVEPGLVVGRRAPVELAPVLRAAVDDFPDERLDVVGDFFVGAMARRYPDGRSQ
jgi:hypothetical protein